MNRQPAGAGAGLIAALAIAVSACGTTSTSTTGQPPEPTGAPAAPAGPRGASGTVAAVTTSDVQVQNPRVGQVRVTFTASTSFSKTVPASAGDLVVGDCALAIAAPQLAGAPAGPLPATSPFPATSVLITPPTGDGGCPGGGFGGPGRGARAGGGPGSGGAAGGAPSSNPNRFGAGRGRGATTSGKITSVNGTGFVVSLGASNATRSVTTTQATTFTKTATTDKSALAVGQCVTAVGPSDDTGTVAASAISIRQSDPTGCGGPGRAGRGTANGNGS